MRILLLTANFPYYPGEQFLEEEIKYWSLKYPGELIILPESKNGTPRKLPVNILVDQTLVSKESSLFRYAFYVYVLFSPVFQKEAIYIFGKYGLKRPRCFVVALRAAHRVYMLYRKLKKYLKQHGIQDIVYVYWFDAAAYAAILLKNEGKIRKVISRAHRFDVYEWVRPDRYMPLKRQFCHAIDDVLSISAEGKAYLTGTYAGLEGKVQIARLGVAVKDIFNPAAKAGKFVIVSISFCTPVKRVDKIIKALAALAGEYPDLDIEWHHIGGGPEWQHLQQMASEMFKELDLSWHFHGTLANGAVHQFLAGNPIDVFINVSDSEGVPVSVMEAMSYGIPAVAPAIGGIPELVNTENGILLEPMPAVQTVKAALSRISFFKDEKVRHKAKAQVEARFNAEQNYTALIDYMQGMSGKK